jgi:hypothetical protein
MVRSAVPKTASQTAPARVPGLIFIDDCVELEGKEWIEKVRVKNTRASGCSYNACNSEFRTNSR